MDKTQPQSSLIVEDLPVLNPDKEIEIENESMSMSPLRTQLGTDAWGDGISPRIKKTKRARAFLIYGGVGILSFLLFLYVSFPFNVVKEVAVSKINDIFIENKLPIRVRVAGLKLKLPIGIQLEELQVVNVNDSSATIKIGRATASVSVLSLLLGKVDADVRLTQSGGNVEINFNDKITSLMKAARTPNTRLPSGNLKIDFKTFEIAPFIANTLAYVRSGNNPALQTIQPFLRLEVSGQLSGYARLALPDAGESLEKATADVDLKIGKAFFLMNDETLNIPRQEFTDARIKAKLLKKSIDIPTETKLVANDIGINLSGRLNVSDNLSVNDVKLNLGLDLKGKVEENFKNLLPILLGCDMAKMVGGKLDAELSGVIGALTCK